MRPCFVILKRLQHLPQSFSPDQRKSQRLQKELGRKKEKKEEEKTIQRLIIGEVEKEWFDITMGVKGRGVIALKKFPPRAPVCVYWGPIVPRKEGKKVVLPYVFDFTLDDKPVSIDAAREDGRFGRLINHALPASGRANLEARLVKGVGEAGAPHLIFYAIKPIEIDDELLYDYGDRSKSSIERDPWLAAL